MEPAIQQLSSLLCRNRDASVTRKLVVPDRVRPLWLRSVPIVDGNIAVVVVKNQVVD